MSDWPQQKMKPKTRGKGTTCYSFCKVYGVKREEPGKGKVHPSEPLNHPSISDSVKTGLLLKAYKHLISQDGDDMRLGSGRCYRNLNGLAVKTTLFT